MDKRILARGLAATVAQITEAHDRYTALQDEARRTNDFDAMLRLGGCLNDMKVAAVAGEAWWARLAAENGASWRQIGDQLGLTRQAAQQRYGSMLQEAQLPLD